MSCTDNAKVSDSGYTNTCGHSQSQLSSRSSLSKNSNRSQSSGYCGGNPSTFCCSNGALPRPISKKKGKEDNKMKLETLMTLCNDTTLVTKAGAQETKTPSYTAVTIDSLDLALKQSEEVGTVELMDATDPDGHNGNRNFNTPKEKLGCQANPLDTISPNSNKGELAAVVSLHDGLVLHLTASLETALGYSKDAWIGQSFIDYVHPKDKATFADKIASSVIVPFGEREKEFNGPQTSLFCSLRRYSERDISKKINMDTGDESDERYMRKLIGPDAKCSATAIYVSFHLHLSFKHYRERDSAHKTEIMFLVIAAEPVISAYKVPEETILSSIFSTRHTVTGHLSHVDDEMVQYFGYLPQDMLGRSLFSYYHPADLPYIKDIYENVVRLEGSLFKSKPYRFAVRNGGYVVLETEWSSFINPWEKKREFVTGHHRVIRGPENPDVFQSPDIQQREFLANMTETMMKESQIIQNEICTLLAEEIPKPTSDIMTKRSNDLATFMASMIHEVNGITTTSTTKAPMIDAENRSFSEHDSVMLGEISPHHEYCDSKSSSETPPSYNQLNYDEKISRFFNSKPLLMAVYGDSEENVNLSAPSNDENINSRSNHTPSGHNLQNHDGCGSRSNENLSSGSNNQTSSTSRDENIYVNSNSEAPYNFASPILTEMILRKHNQEMEKLMVQKHKERRTGIKNAKLNKETTKTSKGQEEAALTEQKTQSQSRGCKRRNSHDQEKNVFKTAKYDESEKNCDRNKHSAVIGNNIVNDNSLTDVSRPTTNVWPQMTVTESQHQSTQNVTQCSIFQHVVPLYYVPVSQLRENTMNTVTSRRNSNPFSAVLSVQPTPQAPYVAAPLTGILYPSIMDASATSSMIHASPIILKVSTVQNQKTQKLEVGPPPKTLDHIKRPESQATSMKVEPGSTTEMSESSRKLTSPGGIFSSCVSVDCGCSNRAGMQPPIDNSTRMRQIDSSLEDSSDSSFYGSFVSRSCGSRCYPEQILEMKMPETYISRSHEAGMTEHRRFSMVNEMKANFELQTARRAATVSQEMMQKGNVDVIQKPRQDHTERNAPPWSQGVKMTPDIIYRYQMTPKTLKEVLEADRDNLKYLHQPMLVNDQLNQLYLDLELDGFGSKLILDDSNRPGDNKDISADASSCNISSQHKPMRREMEYSKMAMVYEDNAPLP